MFENTRLAKSVKLACAFGAVTAASMTSNGAFAQEEATADGEKVEKIEVTGSRIKRTDIETSSPVLAIDAQAIRSTGFTRVEDVMNSMPQIEAAETAFDANGATGTATLDLRGLGSNRTLVLVNGRRLQPGGVISQAPDINQIPTALIKRVDVLTGGASTAYGADAVAGVVNFVMDKDFTGLEIQAGAAGYQHDNNNAYIQGLMDDVGYSYPDGSNGIGGETYNLSATLGTDFDGGRGHMTAYATWQRNAEMLQGERDYSSCALNSSGTACGGSSTAVLPNIYFTPNQYDEDGALSFDDEVFWSLGEDGLFTPYDGSNLYNYGPVNHFMRPTERFTLGTFANYEVNDHVNFYLEASYMNNSTYGQIAESGTFYAEIYELSYDNPLLTDAQKQQLLDEFGDINSETFTAQIGKRNVEGGARANNLEYNSFRIVSGIDGYINDAWSYDLSYMYAQTSSSTAYINDLDISQIGPRVGAIGTTCTGDCLLYNVFQPYGVTAEQAAQLSGTAIATGKTSLVIYQGYVSGEFDFTLPSADTPVAASFGFERRETDYERVSDTVYQQGSLAGQGGPTPSLVGEFDVNDIFAELSVPVLEGVSGVDMLAIDLGFRTSDYTTSGRKNTFKVGFDWSVNEEWKLRGSFNRAIRAPNISELYAAQQVGLWAGSDGCANLPDEDPAFTLEQCQQMGVSADQYGSINANPAAQYNEFSGGNPALNPKEADTITVGVVANPFEGFDFAIDYWDIEMEQVIGEVGAQRILQICANSGTFCDNVVRGGSGTIWRSDAEYVTNLSDNIGGRKWRGVDVDVSYGMDIGESTLTFNMIGSYNLEKTYKPLLADSSNDYDCSGMVSVDCFAQPKWRHNLSMNYGLEDLTVIGRWRYFGAVDIDGGGEISSYSFFDVSGNYTLTENLTVSVGVNNILDKEPPMVNGTLSTNANTVSGFYDTLGRYLFTNATLTF